MAIPYELLLYPELLCNEQLISIIQERYLRVDNVERMSRCELIELFRNYCVPYGQRKYRDTGRGKVLNKSRHYSPEPAPKINITIPNSENRKYNNGDRLKPPPDQLSGQMKRIKLETCITMCETDPNNKRKVAIDTATIASDCPPTKKERKTITWP